MTLKYEPSSASGVGRFYLYDHNSTDKTAQVLAPYIARGVVRLHDWYQQGEREIIFIARIGPYT